MPKFIVEFFAETGIPLPPPGSHVPIATIDRGMEGVDVSTRIAMKGHLRAYDLIAA